LRSRKPVDPAIDQLADASKKFEARFPEVLARRRR
jgi:hypothetical protein